MSEPQVQVTLGQEMLPIVERLAARYSEVWRNMRALTDATMELRHLLEVQIGEQAAYGILRVIEQHQLLNMKEYRQMYLTPVNIDIGKAVAKYLAENINEVMAAAKQKQDAQGKLPDHVWTLDHQQLNADIAAQLQTIAQALRLGPVQARLDPLLVQELEYNKRNAEEASGSPEKPLQGAQ